MPKTKISEFSATPGNNTDIDGINIAEGCAPSGINDAIRELMAQLKDFQAGTAGDSFNGPVGTTTAAAGAFTTLSASSTVSGAGFSTYLASPPAIGGTAAAAGSFTTLTTSSTVTHNGGTANGVAYLNGSKVLTTGSALTFDGTNLLQATGGVAAVLRVGSTVSSGRASTINLGNNAGVARATIALDAGTELMTIGSEGNFPVMFQVNGSEQARLTSTGLGIGTSSPAEKLQVNGTAALFNNTAGTFDLKLYQTDRYDGRITVNSSGFEISQRQALPLLFLTSDTERARIDSSGNLGIGTTSISERLVVNGNASVDVYKLRSNTATPASTDSFIYRPADNTLAFGTASTERARITSGGDFWVGTTTAISPGGLTASNVLSSGTSSQWAAAIRNSTATTPWGLAIQYSGAAPNDTSSTFLYCVDSGPTLRASIRSNGGLANYSANDVNLSDRREKTNFAPAKSYLDTICAIPVQTFNYIDQSEDDPGLTLGVVAQDVQAVAPELVMESNWGTADNPKMRLSVYQTDLQYALMKCIQEQQVMINELKAKVAALEAK